jgi:hypothetical protein
MQADFGGNIIRGDQPTDDVQTGMSTGAGVLILTRVWWWDSLTWALSYLPCGKFASRLAPALATRLRLAKSTAPDVHLHAYSPMEVDAMAGRLPLEEVFAELSSEPIGSASIAQTYTARLRSGRDVVVKVQRPGVRDSIERDLDILTRLADRVPAMARRPYSLLHADLHRDNVIGTYLHGPVLARNPHIADLLLKLVLDVNALPPVDDRWYDALRGERIAAATQAV